MWVGDGAVIAGERLFLVAWEVMDNYRIHSAQQGFGRPAIDFVLVDAEGRMVAVELKMSVRSPRESWSVLCQVTHRAQPLAEEFTPVLLESAYRACYSGAYGRMGAYPDVGELPQAHARFFDTTPLPALLGCRCDGSSPPPSSVRRGPAFVRPSWRVPATQPSSPCLDTSREVGWPRVRPVDRLGRR